MRTLIPPISRPPIVEWHPDKRCLLRANLNAATAANAVLTNANLDLASGTSANLTGGILTSANLCFANLTDANLAEPPSRCAHPNGTNLTNAFLNNASLTGASLTDATVTNADFGGTSLTSSQLYTTHSYRSQNLTRHRTVGRQPHRLELFGENLTGADLRGATGFSPSSAITTNAILPDGAIKNLDFGSGNLTLFCASYHGNTPIHIHTAECR